MARNQADELANERILWQLLGFAGTIVLMFMLIRVLLPLILTIGLGGLVWWAWRWHHNRQNADRAHFNSIFYDLIQAHGGRITILDFAMTAHLPASQAQRFLDDRAREFSAHFEVTDRGDVIYCFQSMKTVGVSSELVSTMPISPASTAACSALIYPLTQSQLAARLNLSTATIRRKKTAPDFSLWSQAKDPENILWKYAVEEQRFYPVIPCDQEIVHKSSISESN